MVLGGGSPAGKHTAEPVIGGSNEILNTVHANEERLEALVLVEVRQTQGGVRLSLAPAEESRGQIVDTPPEMSHNL